MPEKQTSFLDFFSELFKLPELPEEQLQVGYFLVAFAWFNILVFPFGIWGVVSVAPGQYLRPLITTAVVVSVFAAVLFLTKRGKLKLASYLALGLLWVLTGTLALTGGGISAPSYLAYFLVTFLAGLLLGGRALITTTGISILFGLFLVYLVQTGQLPVDQYPKTPFIIWGITSLIMVLLALLQYYNNWVAKHALKQMQTNLAERAQIEKLLRDSEAQLNTVFEASPIAIGISHYDNGKMISVNSAFENLFGFTRAEIIGHLTAELNIWGIEGDRQRFLTALKTAGIVEEFETIAHLRSGEERNVLLSGKVININGELCLMAQVMDITERKKADEKLRVSEQQNRLLFETMIQGVIYQDHQGRILSANLAAQKILGLTLDQMLGKDSSSPYWKIVREDGSDLPMSDHPALVALKSGQPVTEAIVGVVNPVLEGLRWVAINAIPQFKEGQAQPYQVYTTLEDITERKRTEEKLRDNEKRFRALTEHNADGIILLDKQGRMIYESPTANRLTGYTTEERLGKSGFENVHPDDLAQVRAKFVEVMGHAGQTVYANYRAIRKGGELWWVELSATNLLAEPSVQAIVINFRDITERKRVEETLRVKDHAITSTIAGIAISDMAGRINYTNPAWLQMYGYEAETEVLGTTLLQHVEVSAEAEAIIEAIKQTGFWKGDLKCRRRDGSKFPAEMAASVVLNSEGKQVGMIASFTDITAREVAEAEKEAALERLRASEARSTAMLKAVPDLMFRLNRDGVFIDYKADVSDLYTPAEASLIGKHHKELLPPELANLIEQKIKLTLESDALQTFEYQLDIPQQGIQYYEARMTPSEADEVIVIVRNITTRLRANEKLRESEEKYRSLLASLNSVVASVDGEGRFLYLNERAAQQLGASTEALTGKTMVELFPEQIAQRQLANIRKVIREDRAIVSETPTMVNGELRWYHTTIQPVHDYTGRVAYALINSTDIHNLKMAEAALRQQLEVEKVVAEISQQFVNFNSTNSAEIIPKTLSSLGRQVNVDRCYIFTYYPTENEFSLAHEWCAEGIPPSESTGRRFAAQAHPILLQPILRGEVLNVPRVAALPDTEPGIAIIKAQGVVSMLILPLTGEKGLLGLIGFDSIGREHLWQEGEIQQLRIVGRIIANGLDQQTHEQAILALNQTLEQRVGELQLADENAQYRQHLLEQVIQLGKQVSATPNLEQCLRIIYESIRFGLHFDRVGLFLYDQTTQTAQGAYGTDPQGNMVDTHWYVTDVAHWWIWSEALRDPKGLALIENYQSSVNPPPESDMYGVRQYATLACWVGNKPVAMIAVDNLVSQRMMNKADLEALQFFAGYAGLAIENTRLTTGLEQRVAERTAELHQSRASLQAVLDTASDLIQSLDERGHFVYVNSAWCETLGYSAEEARQLSMWQVIDPAYRAHCERVMQKLFASGSATTLDVVFRAQDGRAISVEGNVNLRQATDGQWLTNGFFRDVTLRKQTEQALQQANAELERAMRMKDEFLASMSHELRTPLTGILGLSETLQLGTYGQLNQKQLKALNNIENSGRHLLDLINDILDLSKIEAGKFEMSFDLCALGEICQASLQLIKGMAQQKRQNVSFTMTPDSIMVRVDARRLKQMLVNLLSNAIKFTPEKGALGLVVEANETAQRLTLTVWDKGLGIAPENLKKLFKPFVQLDSRRLTRQYSGTGLGLSLVQRMAELHGGSVEVESNLEEGSRFTIILPWTPENIQPSASTLRKAGLFSRALVIDDNEVDLELLTHYLEGMNITTLACSRSQDAVTEAIKFAPEIILLDPNMPDKSGFEVLAKLQADPRAKYIPVIICSAEDRRHETLAADAAGHLVKPFTFEELRLELSKVAQRYFPASTVSSITQPTNLPLVVIVDDNEIIQGVVSEFLRTKLFRVLIAHNGLELLELVTENNPDIILMDMQMPGMDGLETTRRVRAHKNPRVAKVPIIALTALAMPGDREMCLTAGANEYITKPFILTELLERINFMTSARVGQN